MKKQLVSICNYNGQLVGVDSEGNLWQFNSAKKQWVPFEG